ncbi:WbqC family protein [Methanolobus sediminis]|uniref:WbqC family protein n=1 Tax=Methanolobus sediminis TaxID=3072978 RepID=A0AA51UKU7_9EURY|nr:WbqC family protein [Methanolobus sediminis]WMW25433.1 WbqC family protein [Methanolobus sediminis]
MKVAIHQPNNLPYLGFFHKMLHSDIFVIHDDAQFNDGDFQHRNRIRTFDGWTWLTVPVNQSEIPINEILIKNHINIGKRSWNKAHFETIAGWYKKSPYFSSYEDELRRIYDGKYDKLIDFNMVLINFLIKAFDIDIKIDYSTNYELNSKRTQRIVDTVRAVGGNVYFSGPMGKDYMDMSLFTDVSVEFQQFEHPVYKQCYDGFEANMSAIDALFNLGELPFKE